MGGTMTRKELDRHLSVIKTHRRKVGEYRHAVSRLSDGVADDFSEGLEESYIKLVANIAGDNGRWIDWYIYENDFGRKKYEAGYDGKMKPIKNTRDLLRLIEEGKKK
jgi:hypothetical protein